MPELNNIQTFEEVCYENVAGVFQKFSVFLNSIGYENEQIHDFLNNYKGEYNPDMCYGYFRANPESTKFADIYVIPYITTYKISEKIFVVCKLLIETEKIRKNGKKNYKSGVLKFVQNLAQEMYKNFDLNGIFFTDDAQHLNHIQIQNILAKTNFMITDFDYALIPFSKKDNYKNLPRNYKWIEQINYIEIFNFEKLES